MLLFQVKNEMVIEEQTAMQHHHHHHHQVLHHGMQPPPEMEVTSTVISSQNIIPSIRSEQICDPNMIPTVSMPQGSVGIVHSSGNIIVAASSPIRTINAPPSYSTICIPSSAGVPITTATVTAAASTKGE